MCPLLITWPVIGRASWSIVPSSVHAVGTDLFSRNPQRKVEDWKGTTALKLNPDPKPQIEQLRESRPQPSFLLFRAFLLLSPHSILYSSPPIPFLFRVSPSISFFPQSSYAEQFSWLLLDHSSDLSTDLVYMVHSTWLWSSSMHPPPHPPISCPPSFVKPTPARHHRPFK